MFLDCVPTAAANHDHPRVLRRLHEGWGDGGVLHLCVHVERRGGGLANHRA